MNSVHRLCSTALACLLSGTQLFQSAPVTRAQAPYVAPAQIKLTMFRLTPSGLSTGALCTPGDTSFGCGPGGTLPYPYASNPITISIENDYLLDVVPQEMGLFYHPSALQAQAVAARTYALNNILNNRAINNSISFQAFIPGKFESLGAAPNMAETVCASTNLSNNQKLVCASVGPVRYLTVVEDLPMFAEFAADWTVRTRAGSRAGLNAVDDPISTACDANDFGHGRGMSQEGASRWARGNQCSYAGRNSAPWSVTWPRYEQILFHYYTRARLRDASGVALFPDQRWNLLRSGMPEALSPGVSYSIPLQIQNTGIAPWTCGSGVLSYTLGYRWVLSNGLSIDGPAGAQVPCGLPPGDPAPNVLLPLDDLAARAPGRYTMTLDLLLHTAASGTLRLNDLSWPEYALAVRVTERVTPTLWLPLVALPMP